MNVLNRMTTSRNSAIIAAAVGATFALGHSTANAAVSDDFETAGSYILESDGNATTEISTEISALSGTNSVKFALPDPANDFSKVILNVAPGELKLGDANGSFQAYIPSSTNSDYRPYLYYGVDTNGDGTFDFGNGDSFVIMWSAVVGQTDQWYEIGFNADTNLHVVGNRSGITANTFSAGGTQDTLANLRALSLGAGTWGDLDVLQVRVGAGDWEGAADNFVAYVDDISVVPEPASLALLGLGGGMMLLRRRVRD